ncbi:MAG TPA: hypothetical protein VKU42_11040 [Candidatus Angelobacter sp.]|nr:hypothetical protein [Candidatus Angelobacter sp.]
MAAHRNRLRVRVRSFVTNAVLRYVSEREARIMCAEHADGSEMLGEDAKPLEAIAVRLSRIKAPLTDIRLLAPERQERRSTCTITRSETENNAFVHPGVILSAQDSIRTLDAAVNKVEVWPHIFDERNVVIAAGRAHGVVHVPRLEDRYVNFA